MESEQVTPGWKQLATSLVSVRCLMCLVFSLHLSVHSLICPLNNPLLSAFHMADTLSSSLLISPSLTSLSHLPYLAIFIHITCFLPISLPTPHIFPHISLYMCLSLAHSFIQQMFS